MGLIDNITWLFRKHDHVKEYIDWCKNYANDHAVTDGMREKYATIDTAPKDIDVLYEAIDRQRHAIMSNGRSKPTGRKRCKSTEDAYQKHDGKLRLELQVLNDLYKNAVTVELNKFPVNKACTIRYITDYIGVGDELIIWDILIRESGNGVPYVHSYFGDDQYDISVIIISESEIHISVIGRDYYYSYDYGSRKNVCTMKLPNWRFVKSRDSDIFYVERLPEL